MKRKICVVTGTRAEYGLLYWLMKELQEDPDFELQIIATGMHLSPEFGLTYQQIEQDGFIINEKVEMLLSSDTPVGITKSLGLATIGFADSLERLSPDLLVVLGDRYEILAAVQAALVARIPVAHIAGGDTTEGAIDEAIRHSITKMSHLHFVTNEISAQRVRQLGENPAHVYNVGHTGIDAIKRVRLLEKKELEESLGFAFKPINFLVTFHPVTLEEASSQTQFQELLNALDSLGPEVGIIITKPNSDTDGRVLIKMIDEFCQTRPNVQAYVSLGQQRYLSTIHYVDAVIGNSSSGLYEVPAFKKPTINIGDRQKGRLKSSSVIDCPPEKEAIIQAIQMGLQQDWSGVESMYGDGGASEKIISILKQQKTYKALLQKHFYKVSDEK